MYNSAMPFVAGINIINWIGGGLSDRHAWRRNHCRHLARNTNPTLAGATQEEHLDLAASPHKAVMICLALAASPRKAALQQKWFAAPVRLSTHPHLNRTTHLKVHQSTMVRRRTAGSADQSNWMHGWIRRRGSIPKHMARTDVDVQPSIFL